MGFCERKGDNALMGLLNWIRSLWVKEKPIDIKVKNLAFQSCCHCMQGAAAYRVDLEKDESLYVCEEHRLQFYSDLIVKTTPEPDVPLLIKGA